MATKTVRFDSLADNTEFTCDEISLPLRKTSARKAHSFKPNGIIDAAYNIKPSARVTITVPDPVPPTAEELQLRRMRRVDAQLTDMVWRAEQAQKKMAGLAADQNAWYSTMGYYSGVEEQMKAAVGLDVAVTARRILESDNADHGGFDALKEVAMSHAMRYARFGNHSTSAISNLLEEMKASWWAEVAEACDARSR